MFCWGWPHTKVIQEQSSSDKKFTWYIQDWGSSKFYIKRIKSLQRLQFFDRGTKTCTNSSQSFDMCYSTFSWFCPFNRSRAKYIFQLFCPTFKAFSTVVLNLCCPPVHSQTFFQHTKEKLPGFCSCSSWGQYKLQRKPWGDFQSGKHVYSIQYIYLIISISNTVDD